LPGQLDFVYIIAVPPLPQIYLQESFGRLIPSSAVQPVIEVKSNMKTGDMSVGKESVLLHALDSLCIARRTAADKEPTATVTKLNVENVVPTFLVLFYSGMMPDAIITKISYYLISWNLDPSDFLPTEVLVLSGGKNNKKDLRSYEMQSVNRLTLYSKKD
jgi:hypothetical protein